MNIFNDPWMFVAIFLCFSVLNIIGLYNFDIDVHGKRMVTVGLFPSVVLFHHFVKRRIPIWFILSQAVNEILFISGLVFYYIVLSSVRLHIAFAVALLINFIIFTSLFAIDVKFGSGK